MRKEEGRQSSWQAIWKQSYRSSEELYQAGLIQDHERAPLTRVIKQYEFVLPRYYANLIDRDNPNCPIRLQAIPQTSEIETEWGKEDPFLDATFRPIPRVTRRYSNRILVHLTPNCSMYCRFCFRKTLLNDGRADFFDGTLEGVWPYLSEHPEIEEVIFSGGDPLMATDALIAQVFARLGKFSHVRRVRFHTRVPVTFPMRITNALLTTLQCSALPLVMALHFNHPRELTPQSRQVLQQLKEVGVTLLNQSVLLKGINDNANVLAELSEKLFAAGVLPYYLHHPDFSLGTGHFCVSVEQGMEIYNELRRSLSGYLVPRYVTDTGDQAFKVGVPEFAHIEEHGRMAYEPSFN